MPGLGPDLKLGPNIQIELAVTGFCGQTLETLKNCDSNMFAIQGIWMICFL